MAIISYRYEPESNKDITGIVELLRTARAEFSETSLLADPEYPNLTSLLRVWVESPENILIVHEVHGEIVGLLLGRLFSPGIFSDVPYFRVQQIFVEEGYRRRGVGRALMAQVATIAKERELEWVVTTPPSGDRPELRFLAGLGFAPVGTQRIAQTSTLLRKLEMPTSSRERRIRTLDDMIARRKRAREIHNTPPSGTPLTPYAHHSE